MDVKIQISLGIVADIVLKVLGGRTPRGDTVMGESRSGPIGAIADSEAVLLSAYRNPKAFYASLSAERQSMLIEWMNTGNTTLFEQLFLEFSFEHLRESRDVASTESIDQPLLIAA